MKKFLQPSLVAQTKYKSKVKKNPPHELFKRDPKLDMTKSET